MMSLGQLRMIAKKAGKTEVVLSMDEADATLAKIADLDKKLAACMDHLPASVYQQIFGGMFDDGPN